MWKFCGKTQFPHSFGLFSQRYHLEQKLAASCLQHLSTGLTEWATHAIYYKCGGVGLKKYRNTKKQYPLISFLELRVFEELARNAIEIKIIDCFVSCTTADKKTDFVAWVVSYVIHVYMFIKRHKSNAVWEKFLLKIKVVHFQIGRKFPLLEEYLTCEIWRLACILWSRFA